MFQLIFPSYAHMPQEFADTPAAALTHHCCQQRPKGNVAVTGYKHHAAHLQLAFDQPDGCHGYKEGSAAQRSGSGCTPVGVQGGQVHADGREAATIKDAGRQQAAAGRGPYASRPASPPAPSWSIPRCSPHVCNVHMQNSSYVCEGPITNRGACLPSCQSRRTQYAGCAHLTSPGGAHTFGWRAALSPGG